MTTPGQGADWCCWVTPLMDVVRFVMVLVKTPHWCSNIEAGKPCSEGANYVLRGFWCGAITLRFTRLDEISSSVYL